MSDEREDQPTIVCFCGSTRFRDAFEAATKTETLAGKIVLSVGMFGHQEGLDMDGPIKAMLDRLHFAKIRLADEVLILNVRQPFCPGCDRWCDNEFQTGRYAYPDGRTECCGSKWEMRPYIGFSTGRELGYARAKGKRIRFLEGDGS